MRDKRLDNRPNPPEEIMLVRAGHHLWRLRGRDVWPESVVSSALETIWAAKREMRQGFNEAWLESLETRSLNLRQYHPKWMDADGLDDYDREDA